MQRFEYKIETVAEGMLGSMILGASYVSGGKLEKILNERGAEGWELVMQVVEKRRFLLFWTREAVILTFKRALD